MLNYYELLTIVKDLDAVAAINEAFRKDFRKARDGVKASACTRKKAAEIYKANATTTDRTTEGIFSDDKTAVYLTENTTPGTQKAADISQIFTDSMNNKKPVDICMRESLALARSLGWKNGGERYHISISGNDFDFSLLYRVLTTIADGETYDLAQCYLSECCNGKKVLLLWSKYGLAIVLPFIGGGPDSREVSFSHYMEVQKAIEDRVVNEALKTA